VGFGRGWQGALGPPWILKFDIPLLNFHLKKVVFLAPSGSNIATFPPPWKNPAEAHALNQGGYIDEGGYGVKSRFWGRRITKNSVKLHSRLTRRTSIRGRFKQLLLRYFFCCVFIYR